MYLAANDCFIHQIQEKTVTKKAKTGRPVTKPHIQALVTRKTSREVVKNLCNAKTMPNDLLHR